MGDALVEFRKMQRRLGLVFWYQVNDLYNFLCCILTILFTCNFFIMNLYTFSLAEHSLTSSNYLRIYMIDDIKYWKIKSKV